MHVPERFAVNPAAHTDSVISVGSTLIEVAAVVLALMTFQDLWADHNVVINSDNSGAVGVFTRRHSSNEMTGAMLTFAVDLCAARNITLRLTWIQVSPTSWQIPYRGVILLLSVPLPLQQLRSHFLARAPLSMPFLRLLACPLTLWALAAFSVSPPVWVFIFLTIKHPLKIFVFILLVRPAGLRSLHSRPSFQPRVDRAHLPSFLHFSSCHHRQNDRYYLFPHHFAQAKGLPLATRNCGLSSTKPRLLAPLSISLPPP